MSNTLLNSEIICRCLKKSKIDHFIGGSSLIGLSEGNLTKYARSPVIFIYNYNIYKLFKLLILLAYNGVVPKFKLRGKRVEFRFRKKNNLFNKSEEYYKLIFGKKYLYNFMFYVGNKYISLSSPDVVANNITYMKFQDTKLPVPKDIINFVKKYYNELIQNHYKTYPVYLDNKTEKIAIELLESVSDILQKHKIKYWLDGGTLLGAIRDNKLIPWDHDLDIGIMYANDNILEKLILDLKIKYKVKISSLSKNSKWGKRKYRCIKVYMKEHFYSKNNLCLDIFVFYREPITENGEIIYKYGVMYKDGYYPCNFLDDLSIIKFYNKNYPVPLEYNFYLKRKYGDSWKTPKRDWSVILEDKSIIN